MNLVQEIPEREIEGIKKADSKKGSRLSNQPSSDSSEYSDKCRNQGPFSNKGGRNDAYSSQENNRYKEVESRKETRRSHQRTRREEEVEEYISER